MHETHRIIGCYVLAAGSAERSSVGESGRSHTPGTIMSSRQASVTLRSGRSACMQTAARVGAAAGGHTPPRSYRKLDGMTGVCGM